MKEKPMKVSVKRFYRPTYVANYFSPSRTIESSRGVTVLFELDYTTQKFTALWSVCNGDNFSKKTGEEYAKRCTLPITGELKRELDLYRMLTSNLLLLITGFIDNYNTKQLQSLKLLYNELLRSK